MTSLNTYIDAIKPFAKSIQEKATKLTDVFDEKLKKTQENLERQLTKASEPEVSPRLWKSSREHPFGELVVIPVPIPIVTTTSPMTPEKSKTESIIPEPRTVERRKSRRSRRKTDLENDIQRINLCRSDTLNGVVERECLDELIDIITVVDDLIEKTLLSTEDISSDNDENSVLSESQSDALQTDVSISSTTLDVVIEQSDPCETNLPFEEKLDDDICESLTEQIDTSNNQLDTIQSFISISELSTPPIIDTQEDFHASPLSIIDSPFAQIPHTPALPIIKIEKRFSVVNCYSIPPGTIISHMSCSSTYIYICTNQRVLLYAKFLTNDLNLPLQWYRYSEPAEQLIVTTTNQTVWRLFDKRLYSSNDLIKYPPLGSQWKEMKFSQGQSLLSISINDQCGWYIKEDGTLWLIRLDDENQQSLDVNCPFHLNNVVCSVDKIGVLTNDGQILIRVGCTNDCLGGDGWIFVEHKFGLFDDFSLLTNNTICIIDKKHRLWINQWTLNEQFYEVLCNDDSDFKSNHRYLMSVNGKLLCFTDCQEMIYSFSDALTGIHWSLVQKNTRLQRLIGAFADENHVWGLTTAGLICSSNGHTLEKPRQAQYLTHATYVPDITSQGTTLWSLDESCNIYVRNDVDVSSPWEQLDQVQFDWTRRLVHIVCNSVGVWAVDDQGCVHFRHGHISNSSEYSLLNPAWILIPGEANYRRLFAQIFCGPEDWMVYATDNKQTLYARIGINENNYVGTSWKIIEDCSALELAISEHTLWLLTSHGRIQCRENISLTNPIGTRSTILPGRFHSITVSIDDSQVWALTPQRHLFKLDRLSVLFEK